MQTFLRRQSKLITLKVIFSESIQKYQYDILKSQFHKEGHRHFLKSRVLVRSFGINAVQIQKVLFDLESKRRFLQDSSDLFSTNLKDIPEGNVPGEFQKYFQTYLKLIELMKESKFNQEWFYGISGWYNLQYFKQDMFYKLFTFRNKKQHLFLIDALTWMDPHTFIPIISQDAYTQRKEQKLVQNYYKKLNLTTQLSHLKKVQGLLENISNLHKSRFYSKFVEDNLPKILKDLNIKNQNEIDELFWLLSIYFKQYNDNPKIIELLQNFLCQDKKIHLSHENTTSLINIYDLIGRMNEKIYKTYIKSFILAESEKSVEKQIQFLEFLINSQSNDIQLLNILLKKIEKADKQTPIEDHLKLKLHFLIHYLNISKVSYELGIHFNKMLTECCRINEGNGSVARMMSIQLDEKGRREGNSYFNSDCLRKNRLNTPVKQDQGQPSKKMPNFKKYNNLRFCTIPIQVCVVNDQTKQAVIMQKQYRKFESSGTLPRYLQVRDTVLQHYGFKINYLESMYMTHEPKMTETEQSDEIQMPNII